MTSDTPLPSTLCRAIRGSVSASALALAAMLCNPADALGQTTFTDEGAFLSALPPDQPLFVEDWEYWPLATPKLSGTILCDAALAFTLLDILNDPVGLQVFDFHDTTTPSHYLGVESIEPRYGMFLPGDEVTIVFDPPVLSFGLNIIASRNTLAGVFHLTATFSGNPAVAVASAPPSEVLPDESEVYFLGVVADPGDAIDSVVVSSDEDLYAFNWDETMYQRTGPDAEVFCCPFACADINGDTSVDLNDFAIFATCFGLAPEVSPHCTCSDLNADGSIDLDDFAGFAVLFGVGSTDYPPDCL